MNKRTRTAALILTAVMLCAFSALIVHLAASLYGNAYRQGKENVDGGALPRLGGGHPVKAGERFGKAFRRLVAVLEGEVDDFGVRVLKFQRRKVQAAVPHVLAYAAARHKGKAPLEEEGGKVHLFRHVPDAYGVRKVGFHKVYRRADAA